MMLTNFNISTRIFKKQSLKLNSRKLPRRARKKKWHKKLTETLKLHSEQFPKREENHISQDALKCRIRFRPVSAVVRHISSFGSQSKSKMMSLRELSAHFLIGRLIRWTRVGDTFPALSCLSLSTPLNEASNEPARRHFVPSPSMSRFILLSKPFRM